MTDSTPTTVYNYDGPQPSHYVVPSSVSPGLVFYIASLATTTTPPDGVADLVPLGRIKRIGFPGDPGAYFWIWATRAIMKSELKTVSTDALQVWYTLWPDTSTPQNPDPVRYGIPAWVPGGLIDDTVSGP